MIQATFSAIVWYIGESKVSPHDYMYKTVVVSIPNEDDSMDDCVFDIHVPERLFAKIDNVNKHDRCEVVVSLIGKYHATKSGEYFEKIMILKNIKTL